MKERFLSGLLVFAMLLALIPTVIFAAETDFSAGDTGTAKLAHSEELYKAVGSLSYDKIFACRNDSESFGSICHRTIPLC